MIFDRLCAMAEAWTLPIRALLEQAYLIQTDLIPHEALARHLPLERDLHVGRENRNEQRDKPPRGGPAQTHHRSRTTARRERPWVTSGRR